MVGLNHVIFLLFCQHKGQERGKMGRVKGFYGTNLYRLIATRFMIATSFIEIIVPPILRLLNPFPTPHLKSSPHPPIYSIPSGGTSPCSCLLSVPSL